MNVLKIILNLPVYIHDELYYSLFIGSEVKKPELKGFLCSSGKDQKLNHLAPSHCVEYLDFPIPADKVQGWRGMTKTKKCSKTWYSNLKWITKVKTLRRWMDSKRTIGR